MQENSNARRSWMRVLALSAWHDVEPLTKGFSEVACETIRPPETGLVMLRGRIGGTGSPFNLGEATVTRCSVRMANGLEGHAYIMGHNQEHAKAAAICDALLQDDDRHDKVATAVIEPLRSSLNKRRELAARKAAATKVDFFTLVRGDND
jgi:alpha-D-ribose 1-methylphosphonate 5-triphosphate synthase subunit PhnG